MEALLHMRRNWPARPVIPARRLMLRSAPANERARINGIYVAANNASIMKYVNNGDTL